MKGLLIEEIEVEDGLTVLHNEAQLYFLLSNLFQEFVQSSLGICMG